MAKNTKIQWCDSTVNPTSGCDGCELFVAPPDLEGEALREWRRKQQCYASHVHQNRLAHSFPENYAKSFAEVRLIPGRLQKCTNWADLTGKSRPDKPWLNGKPRLIFISDLSDALSEAVPFEYLREQIIKPVIAWQKNRHIGLWLTKRPQRMLQFARWLHAQGIHWPVNLWAGTSVTNQRTAEIRLPYLLRMKTAAQAKRIFVSYEPARGMVNFDSVSDISPADCCAVWLEYIDLVIVGGESGSNAKPIPQALGVGTAPDHTIEQCRQFGVPCFVKQMGTDFAESAGYRDSHGGDWNEWPVDLRVRQLPEPYTEVQP